MKKVIRFIRTYYCNVPLLNYLPRKHVWIFYAMSFPLIVFASYAFNFKIMPPIGWKTSDMVVLTVVSAIALMLILPLCFWAINTWFHMLDGIRDGHKEFKRALRMDPNNENPLEKEFLCLMDKSFPGFPSYEQFIQYAMSQGSATTGEQEETDVIVARENLVRNGIKVYLKDKLSTYLSNPQLDSLYDSIILVRTSKDIEESINQIEPICLDDALYSRVTRKSLIKSDMNALAYNLKPLLKIEGPELYRFFKAILPNMYSEYKQSSFCAALTRDRHADSKKNYDQEANYWYSSEIEKTIKSMKKLSESNKDEITKLSKEVIANIEAYMIFLASNNQG